MAVKKKTTKAGPKALLMKKNVDQLKRKAKQLGVKNYSTKKKAQLVQSIMLAEARKKKKPTRKKALTSKTSAKKKTRKISAGIARPNAAMVRALEVMPKGQRNRAMKMYGMAGRRNNKQMGEMVEYANFEGFGYRELAEAGTLLSMLADGKVSRLGQDYFNAPYGVKVGFNKNSGNVFLVDEDYNVLMFDGSELDLFISLPYSGEEGFYEDLIEMDYLDNEDREYLNSLR